MMTWSTSSGFLRAFVLVISLIVSAGFVHGSPLAPRAKAQVVTKCTVPNTVALTFDDGPFAYLYDISNALIAAGAKGTFFFNGDNYGCIYDGDNAKRVKYAFDKGHQVASHTWRHAHLTTLNWDQLHDEFWRTEEALLKITGAMPAFMRPPFGEYNDLVLEVAGARGQTVSIWDFDSRDSVGASAAESNSLYEKAISSHPSTLLALNHEVYEQTAHVVIPHAISKLQQAGYKLVTLAECLGKQPYQFTQAPSTPDATWTCQKA